MWGGLGTGSVDRHRNVLQPKAEIPPVAAQGPVASLGVFTCTAAGETEPGNMPQTKGY